MKRLSMTILLLLTVIINVCAEVKVVFAGDGITDGAWGRSKGAATAASDRNLSDLNHHLGDGYVFLCGAWYQSQYPTLGITIQNRGIVGNTLDDLSARWQTDILSLNPDVISVLIGNQDVDNYISTGANGDFDVEGWTTKYRSMLTAARTANANVKLVLCAPFCGSNASNYSTRKELLAQLAAKIQALASEFSAVYVPFNEIADKEPSAGYFFWDGTLPTAAGQYEMFKEWVSVADGYVIGNTTPKTIGPAKTQDSKGKRRILYIGDSITDAGWGLAGGSALNTNQRNLTALDHILGHGYAMLCAGWYQTVYPEVNYEVINRGISGNTLANLASRWETDVIANSPDVLSILIGTNDIDQWLKGEKSTSFDYDAWEAQYRSLISRVKADNPLVQIALGTPFVGSRSSEYETRSTMVANLAARVRTIATSLGCTLIPYDELFAELTSDQPNTAYWIWDGIHPSPAGHYMMHQLWLEKAGALVFEDAMPEQSTELQTGGQFMDLLLPMEGSVAATESDWGTTAGEETNPKYAGTWKGTLGRWKDNGIEDTERSYWGANIIKGNDGKYHMYVAGWPSATCGHMQWSSKSMVYHVTSDNVWGPYTYASTLGTGHNPEIYKTGDTYVIYKIEPLGYYKSTTLGDAWETGEYTFDLRDRALIAGENRETSLSNCSFAKREDGSFVMIDRGGGIWVSRDGLTDPWHQISTSSVYLNSTVTNRGTLEDPVIWRDHLQYHMIVNDWKARYAYYYRSKDGLHWVMESGKAYTGQDPFAKHSDGTVEAWHKYERPRVYQDELGRAIRMNFAVIDCVKQSDMAGDSHSSKNINMPVTRQLQLEVQGNSPITSSTTSIQVLVKAEDGFNPRTDLNLTSLKFGAHNKVNFGNGLSYSSSENSGTSDLIITFTGVAGQSGITEGEWAPKMLGLKTDGSIAFGYAKMPGVDYKPAMLSAVTPTFTADGTVQTVSVTNYGQLAATATTVRIYAPNGTTLLAHGTTSALAAYASETVTLTKDATAQSGYKTIIVRFYDGETLLNEENIALTAIIAAQNALQAVITEAETFYADEALTNGKPALKTAIDNAKAMVTCYNTASLTEQQTALSTALNAYKYANASPTNGLAITIPNATMDDLSEWTLTRKDADNAPGWKTNAKGGSYEGFEGSFMEYWVSQANALGYANRASQTLPDMPAGRYRLRAQVIATRQNSNDAVTGVALYANSQRTTCATAKDGTPQEYMVEIRLEEAGSLEIGIDVAASTTANWVAWDNVSLKYFGNQEGEIVEEEVEPLTFDQQKVYRIKWYDHNNYTKLYWQSPKYDTTGNTTIHRTANEAEAAQFIIRSVENATGKFYLYDVVSHQYVVPSGNSSNGTAWTWSAKTLGKAVIVESGDAFTISSTAKGYANAFANDNNDGDVKNYGSGSKWTIEEAGENTATFGIAPQAVYRLTHHNTNRYRYLASEPSNEGNLLTTNTDSEKGAYSLLPVSGRDGYYYIYNKDGYFVTPSTGNWTLSKTTPVAVKVAMNTEYMEDYFKSHTTTDVTFMLGEANQHANAQRINNVELVKAYADHPLDKGNNWVLEPVANATATISLNAITSNIDNLIASAIAEDIDMTYTVPAATLGYQTFAADCALDFTDSSIKAYIATNVNNDKVYLQQVTKAPAGTGLLLEGTDADIIPVLTTNDADDVNGNLLRAGDGTTIIKEDDYNKYVLAADDGNTSVSFYLINNTSTIVSKGKAYLKVPVSQSNNARHITFSFGGDVTGIESVSASTPTTDSYYNMAGQRVVNPTHGLYIKNGKKIYIK